MRSNTANSAMEVSVERTEILAKLLAIFTFAGVRLLRPEVKTDLASVMNLNRNLKYFSGYCPTPSTTLFVSNAHRIHGILMQTFVK